ncbi:peroxiredoxin [Sinomonas gamaensis]|uniref:peroxiredoxin n=1 Tax=Sinomonas gamaensis TaxID=2565624 RepID=UPI0011087DE5|nr:peroxiredoxin [Sinomonas gamaensis]
MTVSGPGIPGGSIGPGDGAPDFTLSNQFGEPIRLSALRGRPVVLVFYPFAFSQICTSELAAIRDRPEIFSEAGAEVLAVSIDSKYALRAYAESEGYSFHLLADFWPHGAVARQYGVFDEGSGMALRGTFILDRNGVVRYRVVNPRGQPRNIEDYAAALSRIGGTGPNRIE